MTENSDRLSSSDRLRGAENYHSWNSRVYNILEGKGLEDYIEPTCVKPEPFKSTPASTPTGEGATPSSSSTPSQDPSLDESAARTARLAEIKAWKANNGRAKTTIQSNCTQEPNDLIVKIPTASEMWSVLRSQYEGKGQSLKAQYLKEIQQLDYNKFDSMTSFVVAFKKLHSSLEGVNMNMLTDFYILTFLEALNSAYPIWTDRWRHASRNTAYPITLEMLYTDATDEARDRNPTAKETSVALYANNPKLQKGGRGRGNKASSSQTQDKCSHCSKPNYKEEDCFKKYPEKKVAYEAKKKANRETSKTSASNASSSTTTSSTALTSFQMYAGDVMVSSSFKNH